MVFLAPYENFRGKAAKVLINIMMPFMLSINCFNNSFKALQETQRNESSQENHLLVSSILHNYRTRLLSEGALVPLCQYPLVKQRTKYMESFHSCQSEEQSLVELLQLMHHASACIWMLFVTFITRHLSDSDNE